jgi:hypothetical protein
MDKVFSRLQHTMFHLAMQIDRPAEKLLKFREAPVILSNIWHSSTNTTF